MRSRMDRGFGNGYAKPCVQHSHILRRGRGPHPSQTDSTTRQAGICAQTARARLPSEAPRIGPQELAPPRNGSAALERDVATAEGTKRLDRVEARPGGDQATTVGVGEETLERGVSLGAQ